MKTILYTTILFGLIACSSKPANINGNINIDTLKINNLQFIQILKDNQFNCLVSIHGDTIIKSQDYYADAEFIDINEDGYKDIRVLIFSNTPNQCDNYLFDSTTKTFKLIEHCDLDIQKVAGTDFYYSYNRAGCADLNWESHLSKIENYDLVNYGYMHGQGCDIDVKNNPQVIEILKVTNTGKDEKQLIVKLPYLKNIPDSDDKWNFIKNYWITNFGTFDR